MATDASPHGIGCCQSVWDLSDVGLHGRQHEKWRYRTEGAIWARQSALGTEPLKSAPMFAHSSPEEAESAARSFDETSPALLEPVKWRVAHGRLSESTKHITKLEGDAFAWGLCHSFRAGGGAGKRCRFLLDNMAVTLSIGKGRSSSPLLQHTLAMVAAFSLATGSVVTGRWIPSELNIADGLSRGRPIGGCEKTGHRPKPSLEIKTIP